MPKFKGQARSSLVRAQERIKPYLAKTGWSTLEGVVGPLLSVAVAPVLLNSLGIHGFGLWVFAVAIAGFGGLASLGVGVAITKCVAEDLASACAQQAVETTRAALAISLGGGLLLTAVSALFAPALAATVFVRMGTTAEVSAALVLGAVLLALQEVDGIFTGALRGAQRFDSAARVEISMRIAWTAVILGVAWYTRDVIATLIASIAVSALKAFFKGYAAQTALKGKCMIPAWSTAPMQRLLQFGKWMWVQIVGGIMFSVVDRLLVGALFGAADLARYSICMQLAQLVHSVQATALQPLFPWTSARLASPQSVSAGLLKRIAFLAGGICLVIPLILIVFTDSVLNLWINPAFAGQNSELCRIMIAGYGLLAFSMPAHYVLLGMGAVRVLAVINLVAGAVSVIVSLAMYQLGLEFFATGKLIFASLILLNFITLSRLLQFSLDTPSDHVGGGR